MDQQKIGLFLKELRKQKGVTQEQVAEVFHVSNRTVSRWENGNNMPDLDVLIIILSSFTLSRFGMKLSAFKQRLLERNQMDNTMQQKEDKTF